MMTDEMIDEALVEILRAKRALEALRKARQGKTGYFGVNVVKGSWIYPDQAKEHAGAKRATLDLTRKLAQLRAGK